MRDEFCLEGHVAIGSQYETSLLVSSADDEA